jgi:hypothetical protein
MKFLQIAVIAIVAVVAAAAPKGVGEAFSATRN